jgi:hypothetical protein
MGLPEGYEERSGASAPGGRVKGAAKRVKARISIREHFYFGREAVKKKRN